MTKPPTARPWPRQRVCLVPGGHETARIRPGLPDEPTGDELGAMQRRRRMTHFEIDDVSVECSIDCVNLAGIMAGRKNAL